LKRRQKCKKSGTLKPPRAAIMTNEPIQSTLDYRLHLAVSIDMLVWVTKPVLLILWDLEVTWFEPKKPKSRLFDIGLIDCGSIPRWCYQWTIY
jgi:hypothetical protein